ncbi:Peptidoglycan-associated lipoprotein [subsurface metagenome]
MRIVKLSVVFLVCACVVLINGCGPELQDLRIQNAALNKNKAKLESKLQVAMLELQRSERQLATANEQSGIEVETLQERIAALREDIGKKKELIASMQQRLLGGVMLPVELSIMLEEFAEREDMVTFDPDRGIVKFKSDLLFKSGSDEVLSTAVQAVKALCKILNSEKGNKFDIIIAGHTDDQPIRYSKPKHPTNWHLSAHRAISVLNVMAKNNIAWKRLSARGFGEFRPIVPNEPGNKGNQQNRRVEIYIVPEGM